MPKKKSYEVTVKGWSTVLVVEAKDEKDAMDVALDQVSMGDFQMDEAQVTATISTPDELDRARAHADCICEP